MQPLAVGADGKRVPKLERKGIDLLKRQPGQASLSTDQRREILHDTLEPMSSLLLQPIGEQKAK